MDLEPQTSSERVYAMGALLVGMLGFSVFISLITSSIVYTMQRHQKHTDSMRNLREYFLRHQISADLMLGVKRYLDRNKVWGDDDIDDAELLLPLPLVMQKGLMLEARLPTLSKHRLFVLLREEYPTVLRDICHSAFTMNHTSAWHGIFLCGDACQVMQFVESGVCKYLPGRFEHGTSLQQVCQALVGHEGSRTSRSAGAEYVYRADWVCEPALWIKGWQNKGSLFATVQSRILCLDSERLEPIVGRFPQVHLDLAIYARWVLDDVHSEGDSATDLWSTDNRLRFSTSVSTSSGTGEGLMSNL